MSERAGTCANCGGTDDDLAAVHRVYLVPDEVRVEQVEAWCGACRSQYPHVEASAGGE